MTHLDKQAGDRDSLSELQGKTAIITGTSRGVGRDMAITLGGAGAHVVVNYAASEDAAAGVVDKMSHVGGQAILCRTDVSRSTVAKLCAKTSRSYAWDPL